MPSPCWMPSCWPWASGSRATTARRSAKCCAACCRWHPTSAAAKSIRSPTPAATPPASFCSTLRPKTPSSRSCACSTGARYPPLIWSVSCRWPPTPCALWSASASSWSSRSRPSAILCARPPTACASRQPSSQPAPGPGGTPPPSSASPNARYWPSPHCSRAVEAPAEPAGAGPGGHPAAKLGKPERELLAFLELHPGSHNLKDLESMVRDASPAARALARKKLVTLRAEPVAINAAGPVRAPHALNPPQAAAFDQIGAAIQAHEFRTFLLHGVTGSGKTEVYLNAIEAALACGRSALLLVPEIALTPAVAGQFFSRFGDRVAILHSAFSDSERSDQWRRIRSGAAAVVVGTRSGVFAPMRNLGLIVVDEEHDQSYKQEETPRYNGRDVAIVRAQAARACVVLGSATPSLESRYNAERGKYTLLELPTRVEERPMPRVELIDMRTEFLETRKQATFSRRLLEAVAHRIDNGEQTIILLNRRGFSSFVACRSCGERVQCMNCSVTLTFH